MGLVGVVSAWSQWVWSLDLVGVISRWGHWMWSVGVVSGCGQWVVDNYTFYLIMKYPYSSVSVLFSSFTLTFHSIFVNSFFFLVYI